MQLVHYQKYQFMADNSRPTTPLFKIYRLKEDLSSAECKTVHTVFQSSPIDYVIWFYID